MPGGTYPLEPGGEPRLAVSYGLARWSTVTIQLDSQVVMRVPIGQLMRGIDVPLSDGSAMRLALDPNLGTLGGLQVTRVGAPGSASGGMRALTPITSVKRRSQALLAYAFMFAAFGVIIPLVGVIVGIAYLVGDMPGQDNPIIMGAAFIAGGLVIGALCWISARGLWQTRAWARIPVTLVVVLLEAAMAWALLFTGNFFLLIPMVGGIIPLIQLMVSGELSAGKAGTAAATGPSAPAAQAAQAATPGKVTLAAFQRQVESALSPETRARLNVSFTDDPIRCWFPVSGAWGWIECQSLDAATSACGAWEVSLPGGRKTVIEPVENAFLAVVDAGG